MCVPSRFSHVWFFVTLWTVAHQAPVSMGFSGQEYWSELPCSPPGDLPDPGIQPLSLMFPALAGGFFTTSTTPISNKSRNSSGFKKGLTYVTEDCFSHLLYRCSFLMITKRLSLFQTYILIPQSPGVQRGSLLVVPAQVQGFSFSHWTKLCHKPTSKSITLGGTWR